MPIPKRPARDRASGKPVSTVASVLLATILAALAAGCRPVSSPGASAPGAAARTPAAQPEAAKAPASGCTPDYCTPASWDTATTPTPLPQIPPFAEPLNVVISARSNVPLTAIQGALGDWKPVYPDTTASVAGIHLMCISTEKADVAHSGFIPQQAAWRLGGCVHGNELSLRGDEGHVRMWHQPVPGSASGAWFIAASYETMCLVKDGRLQTAAASEAYAALHPSKVYHCVDGGPATIATAYPDGYDDGAKAFAAAVTSAARARGWRVSRKVITVPRAAHAGEGGVPFGPGVEILTITRPG